MGALFKTQKHNVLKIVEELFLKTSKNLRTESIKKKEPFMKWNIFQKSRTVPKKIIM